VPWQHCARTIVVQRTTTVSDHILGKKKPLREGGVLGLYEEDLPAAAVAATAAAAATGALLGLGHVHTDGASIELGSVEGCNGLVRRLVILEGDKAETTRAAGLRRSYPSSDFQQTVSSTYLSFSP
jgi:hypothetical protein